jgi:hypothetical protein
MPTDYIRYDLLVQDALRSVVRKVLTDAARTGLPGEHHFNISFKTHAPGVVIPAQMRQRYPDEMAIILQHEFWDLNVNPDGFEVSLNFSRKPERLTVPFDSITGFSDPSVPFGFKLEPRLTPAEESARELAKPARGATSAKPATTALAPGKSAEAAKTPDRQEAKSGDPKSAEPKSAEPKSGQAKSGEAKSEAKSSETAPSKIVSIDAFRKK